MKQGDIVITEDNIKLIAVPYFDHTAPCCDCYFYKEGECGAVYTRCWDKENGNEFILVESNDV